MKKINVIILIFAVLFFIFTCSEPAENHSFSSEDLKSYPVYSQEFTTPGDYTWKVPDNISESATATIVAGGGGGGKGYAIFFFLKRGGGGGAGQRLVENIQLTPGDVINIKVGNGGSSGSDGGDSAIITCNGNYIADGGSTGKSANIDHHGSGGSGYGPGSTGNDDHGGSGGSNGAGGGTGGTSGSGSSASANSGGGGGGGGSIGGIEEYTYSGGKGGSGYIRIDYTVAELP